MFCGFVFVSAVFVSCTVRKLYCTSVKYAYQLVNFETRLLTSKKQAPYSPLYLHSIRLNVLSLKPRKSVPFK